MPDGRIEGTQGGRDSREGPLFSFKDGQLLTRSRLVSAVGNRGGGSIGRDWDLSPQFPYQGDDGSCQARIH